jgi:hypothetical protein
MATVNRYKIDISFFPEGDMLIHYGKLGTWGTDPFTDNDKRNIIEVVKTLEYTADGEGNYYNLSPMNSMTTEGTGTVEGEIWLLTMLHHMDIDTFKTIKEWKMVGQEDGSIIID